MGFLTGSVQFVQYIDSEQTEFPQEQLANINQGFSDSNVSGLSTVSITLAPSGTQSYNFNGVSPITAWYAFSSASPLTLTVNGSATPLTMQQNMPGFIPITLTSLTIANASVTVATTVTLVFISG